jgi:hypothetical protein
LIEKVKLSSNEKTTQVDECVNFMDNPLDLLSALIQAKAVRATLHPDASRGDVPVKLKGA